MFFTATTSLPGGTASAPQCGVRIRGVALAQCRARGGNDLFKTRVVRRTPRMAQYNRVSLHAWRRVAQLTPRQAEGRAVLTPRKAEGSVLLTPRSAEGSVLLTPRKAEGSVVHTPRLAEGSVLLTPRKAEGSVRFTPR